jgi:hypothetical protein
MKYRAVKIRIKQSDQKDNVIDNVMDFYKIVKFRYF